MDMGPAMVLEVTLQPKRSDTVDAGGHIASRDMTLDRLAWPPQRMFLYAEEAREGRPDPTPDVALAQDAPANLQGRARNEAFAAGFRSRVGGLGPQIESIVRRVLDGRVLRPAEVGASGEALSYREAQEVAVKGGEENGGDALSLDSTSQQLSRVALEAEELALLGLTPVRGLLLYGPPGAYFSDHLCHSFVGDRFTCVFANTRMRQDCPGPGNLAGATRARAQDRGCELLFVVSLRSPRSAWLIPPFPFPGTGAA